MFTAMCSTRKHTAIAHNRNFIGSSCRVKSGIHVRACSMRCVLVQHPRTPFQRNKEQCIKPLFRTPPSLTQPAQTGQPADARHAPRGYAHERSYLVDLPPVRPVRVHVEHLLVPVPARTRVHFGPGGGGVDVGHWIYHGRWSLI